MMDDEEPVVFHKMRRENGWMSMMAPLPVSYWGTLWRTAEHLWQAGRLVNCTERQVVNTLASPGSAQFYVRKVADANDNLRMIKERSPEDLDWLHTVLCQKLDQYRKYRLELIKTGTRPIIWNVSTITRVDLMFWGAVLREGNWIGRNNLGKMYEKVREEL